MESAQRVSDEVLGTLPSGSSLIRLRLLVALLALAVVPLALTSPFVALLLYVREGGQPLYNLLSLLVVLLAGVILLLVRGVLRSAFALDRSRTELLRMYDAARADSLVDRLTGLATTVPSRRSSTGSWSNHAVSACRSPFCSWISTASTS